MKLESDLVGRFLDECYAAGIKDPRRFLVDKIPRLYGFLKGAFPRGVLPTDIDGEVELNGQFLRFEFKHDESVRNGRIPKGQMLCFQRLVETGFHTVFLVGHDSAGEPTYLEVWSKDYPRLVIDPCDKSRLRRACEKWVEKIGANSKPGLNRD